MFNTYRESQKKVYITKIILLINYRYFYLKITSLEGSKIKAKQIKQNFFNVNKFFHALSLSCKSSDWWSVKFHS